MKLGRLTLANRTMLAPLAGVSDIPFRRLCQEFGAGLTFVEMLSATALNMENGRTDGLMARHPTEQVLGVQVTGPSAEAVAKAIQKLDALNFETIDINMGCPARKIVGSNCGCSILKEPERISATVSAARAATAKPLSIKIRLGYDAGVCTVADTARRVREGGADALTIHGRFRTDTYAVRVRREMMAAGFVEAGEMAKIGNGDILDFPSAMAHVERGGCEAVMVSRGALGNPWIFQELLTGQKAEPTLGEWEDVLLRHIAYHEEHHGENELSARRIRKHLIWYASGYPRCNRERKKFGAVSSMSEARDMVRAFVRTLPRELKRFEDPHHSSAFENDPKFQMDRTADAAAASAHNV